MKKILLVDYYGTCNSVGKAVGHSPKVAMEYRGLFFHEEYVDAALSPCIAKEVVQAEFQNVYKLKFDIVEADYNRFLKRFTDKFRILYNIHQVFSMKGYDIIWFYRSDFFLLLYMMLLRRKNEKRKIICLIYQIGFGGGIIGKVLDYISGKGIAKFDGIIVTQKNMTVNHKNVFYMPDYRYNDEVYGRYRRMKKEERATCLGAMNPYKKLETLAEVFKHNRYPILISGYFFEKERAERLQKTAAENLMIKNCIMEVENYYETLASAKFTILPYDMQQYHNRTSGILIESAFTGVIPIAPTELLEFNQIRGIGYRNMNEITQEMLLQPYDEIIADNMKFIDEYYDGERIRCKFINWFSSL